MRMVMIATLAAAQTLAAAPAWAADLQSESETTRQAGMGMEAQTLDAGEAPESPRASAPQADEPRKKRKSTGDKVLTGAAVVLGVGALVVGGLLVAIFVG